MRDPSGRNAAHASELLAIGQRDGADLHVTELDVQSQESAGQAVKTILDQEGQLNVVVHNAGHLAVGYVEAFTAEEIARLFDINVLGAQRVNRAVLPHMRARRSGSLVYVGSTTTVSMPPFLGPYVASKAAFDALAQETSYEVSQLGIETTIIMPGAFTRGTEHFPNASHASDQAVSAAYAALDPIVARNEEATARLIAPGADADPATVAAEITRILALPAGAKPAQRHRLHRHRRPRRRHRRAGQRDRPPAPAGLHHPHELRAAARTQALTRRTLRGQARPGSRSLP
jgi:NAD(P)-dependent dehydrogenase (short-subunit alcohol dehydrogenase family)